MDVGRLTSGGKKLFSWIPVHTQSLAAYLNHHRVQTKHPYFSVVLEALCFSEKEGKEGCPTPCPTVQLFSQDNSCMVTAPGLCSSLLVGMQGMAHGGYLPSFQCCRGWGDAHTPAAEDVEAAAFQASEAPASARADSVTCSPSFSVHSSCSSADAVLLPPHPTVYADKCCSLQLLSRPHSYTWALGTHEEAARKCTGFRHPHSAAPWTFTDN